VIVNESCEGRPAWGYRKDRVPSEGPEKERSRLIGRSVPPKGIHPDWKEGESWVDARVA